MGEGNQAKTAAAPLVAVLAADIDFHDEFHRPSRSSPAPGTPFADEDARTTAATVQRRAADRLLPGRRPRRRTGCRPDGRLRRATSSAEFFPDGRHRALLVVNIGHPTEQSYRPRQPRLGYDDVVSVA